MNEIAGSAFVHLTQYFSQLLQLVLWNKLATLKEQRFFVSFFIVDKNFYIIISISTYHNAIKAFSHLLKS